MGMVKVGEKGFLVVSCFLLVLFMEMSPILASRSNPSYQNLEIAAQLRQLNKPAVKSIKSQDGDMIDCIKITHQIAFDHPLLRNHTIQMAPSFYPEGVLYQNSSKMKRTKTQLWQLKGSCPKGTIPVRRTKEEDLLRARSIKEFGKKKQRIIPQPTSANPNVISPRSLKHQHAIASVSGNNYHGAKATINVWNPVIDQPTESSSSQIWILAGSSGRDLNSIEVGWHASPDLYGDNKARLFTYWTRDDYQKTGCYNLLCSGFVQINTDIALGANISPVSTYQGSQYDITVLVRKDVNSGNYWLTYGNDVLGYWPSSLFSYLADSASTIQWGGQVLYTGGQQTTFTQMGSGHFSNEGYGKASYFKNIQIADESNDLQDPQGIITFTDQSNCYDIHLDDNTENWGNYFYYGGPGRSQICP